MKRLIIFIISIFPVICSAQDEEYRHRLSLEGSVSTKDTYSYGAGYHYMITNFVGIGGKLGVWSFFPKDCILGETTEERDSRENLYFKPSVLLVSPCIFRITNCTFHLECESAMMISTRQNVTEIVGNSNRLEKYKTDCISWHCNFGIDVRYNSLNFTVGYTLSNLDVNRRYNNNGSYSKKPVHNFGIKIGVCF